MTKQWYLTHREHIKAYQRQWYLKHKEHVVKRAYEWYKRNLPENRAKRSANNARRRLELIAILGGKCPCGFADPRALQIDHVHGSGAYERRGYGHSSSALKHRVIEDVKNHTGRYQLLCANCNWIKRHEEHELLWNKRITHVGA